MRPCTAHMWAVYTTPQADAEPCLHAAAPQPQSVLQRAAQDDLHAWPHPSQVHTNSDEKLWYRQACLGDMALLLAQ